ncbi:hypothetical protein F511_41528 [Dorcoceras hygrometricum]|uniref:Uncharacterized protein n=1 Tax=Dorcoceras hygrometricum TaxID=472368 RepID=A0A2Z7CUL8_9LAMI|nr:hypothetical protein F511_41528 [Dorcoceras hygrometricum]
MAGTSPARGGGAWQEARPRGRRGGVGAAAKENYNTLTSQFSELVDYINRGGDAKKREGSSSRGLQPPPDDRSRPGSGDSSKGRGSRSEPARKRGGGGSHRRYWRYWIGGS